MMELNEAYIIFKLEPGANSDEVNKAYKELIKECHPDKGPEDENLSYKLNEARDVIKKHLESHKSNDIALYVSNAILAIREEEKKEQESKKEVELLISVGTRKKRERIGKYRNRFIVTTFIMTILAVPLSGLDNRFNLNVDEDLAEIKLDMAKVMYPAVAKSKIENPIYLDSLYSYDQKFRSNVDDRQELFQKRANRTDLVKFFFTLFVGLLGAVASYFHLKLSQYKSNLDEFRKILDIKSKLKKLLLGIMDYHNLDETIIIEESKLMTQISLAFERLKVNLDDNELNRCLKLGKKLEINDIERIVLLKLLEKNLIVEVQSAPENVYYKVV